MSERTEGDAAASWASLRAHRIAARRAEVHAPRRLLAPLLILSACSVSPGPIEAYDPLPLVDPMIGTGGVAGEVAGLNPGAALPFGMTLVGPQTSDSEGRAFGLHHFGGYHADDTHISGFAHEHADGMGTNDFGTIVVMPRSGEPGSGQSQALAPFSHRTQTASPGFYAVTLDDEGIEVAIAATMRGAVHRLRFPAGVRPHVWLDLGHVVGSVEIGEASVDVDFDAGTMDAFQRLNGGYSRRIGGLQTWAHISASPAASGGGTWVEPDAPQAGEVSARGERAGAWLSFPEGTREVILRVALSHVDGDGARANHQAELAGRSFEDLKAAAESAWRSALGGVRVRGGTGEQRRIFHTALYHAYLWPNRFDDVDGRYRGLDGLPHRSDLPYHSNFSMWDTFRTTHPWLILARPEDQRAMLNSLLRMVEDGGELPRWPLGHGYTGGMVGTPAAQIFAESALKGLTGWDQDAAFAATLRAINEPNDRAGRAGLEAYLDTGYVPMEAASGSASRTIEFAWNDHAVGLWAAARGQATLAAQLLERGRNWRHHWDAEQGFVVGRRADGSFNRPRSPESWSSEYVEGNAWHYRWPAPYDIDGIIALQYGGDSAAFLRSYAEYWQLVAGEDDDVLPDDYYWHGNEPDLHYPWLAALAGHPEASLEPLRHVMATRYGTDPAGLDGNDDAGTLSSWYLFAAIGLYPVAGTSSYAVTAPIFDRVEIDRPEGLWVIDAEGLGGAAPAAVRIGDDAVVGGTVDHEAMIAAGGITFAAAD